MSDKENIQKALNLINFRINKNQKVLDSLNNEGLDQLMNLSEVIETSIKQMGNIKSILEGSNG